MKKLLLILLIPFFAISQTNPNREYWQTNKWTAKKGMNAEFETAVAKKTNKYNNTKETSIFTYQINTGPDQGKYMRVLGNRNAASFDEDNASEMAFWMKNVMPYVDSNDGNIRWWRLKGAGLNWDNDVPPARFLKMTTYNIKRGNMSDFFRFWNNNIKLQKELGYSGIIGVFMLESGGQGYQILEVEPYNSHAEGMGKFKDPDVNYVQEYNKMFGWRSHRNDQKAFNDSIEQWGISIETAELKPKMSSNLK
ncbi:MAG: Uncharacterised protein [Flavobacterium sp. SCGC AAA160-P02]|nr:MAG: Uncharacterised protein [Flavobacterium sp. SCGC AAA160-P02]